MNKRTLLFIASFAIIGVVSVVIIRATSSGTVAVDPSQNDSLTSQASEDAHGGDYVEFQEGEQEVRNPIDLTAIPIGDGNVSAEPKAGYTYACNTNFREGGARHIGDWYDEENGTWNYLEKVQVQGDVAWPNASYAVDVVDGQRIIETNGLPGNSNTGNFPIARNDPAYQYDTNPNAIGVQDYQYAVSTSPELAAAPSCVPLGPIGVMNDGVVLFNALDDAGLDAVAHETQDQCDGHPSGNETYHYHNVANCTLEANPGSSELVGYALDGFGIYVERDGNGDLLTNSDLDECHGRTSVVVWDGEEVDMYHYVATHEYPYTIGCFKGTPVVGPGTR